MSETIISPGVFQIESDQSLYTQAPQVVGAVIVGPTVGGRPFVPTYVTTYNQFLSIFGDVFKSGSYYYEYFTSMAAREYFNNGGQTLLVTKVISGSANASTYATSTVRSALNAASSSFELEVLAWGDQMNNAGAEVSGALVSGSSLNVRWEIASVSTGSGTFTINIRRGDDNNSQKNILETWANVSLDPQQPNFISRVIGDLKPVYTPASGANAAYIDYQGSYSNASRYVRVKSVTTPNVDSIDNNGNFKVAQYSGSLPVAGTSGSFSGGVADTNRAKLMNEAITTSNIQGFSPDDYNIAFGLLANKDEYQFNVLLSPGVGLDTAAADDMVAVSEGRGDNISIVDAGIYGTSIVAATSNAAGLSSNYGATYYPWVQLFSNNLGKVVWCPPSTVVGGVLAFNDQVSAEWFAPAGLNRGGIPSVIRTEKRLQQSDRDTLYAANVNPLASFPGTGVCVWGQKTLQRKPTALDRVNVRRLLISLKDFIGGVSRNLVFEQNTNATRNRFLAQVNPYLESVVQRQGLYAYKVVMDDTNNTPDVIDRNQLVGQIFIQPTKTAEFIILNFNILPTGVTFPA
jgi:phage tail sheath protein FI